MTTSSSPTLAGGSEAVLDFDKDWSLGITLVGLGSEGSADQKYVTLASNGTNAVYLRRGGTNWGFYVGTSGSNAGANTWVAPGATSRILLVYCKYYSPSEVLPGRPCYRCVCTPC